MAGVYEYGGQLLSPEEVIRIFGPEQGRELMSFQDQYGTAYGTTKGLVGRASEGDAEFYSRMLGSTPAMKNYRRTLPPELMSEPYLFRVPNNVRDEPHGVQPIPTSRNESSPNNVASLLAMLARGYA